MKKCFAIFLFSIIINVVHSQNVLSPVHVLLIDPSQTGDGIKKIHGPHLAMYDTSVIPAKKLFLMIPGTGGVATDTRVMDSIIAGMGYHVIGLDYKNNIITTVCSESKDSACFDNFRQEIMFGTPVSNLVEVDSANSIINRFKHLLLTLVKTDPSGGWDAFIKNDIIQWKKIIVAGHSQGSGHAAYIGYHYKVNKVLILSGPQDYRVTFHSPATWLLQKSKTPVSHYYAFLNINDPFDVTRQLANCKMLMHTTSPDSVTVMPVIPVVSHKHILINNIITSNPHGSTLFPEFKNVWEYMLGK